MILTYEVTKTLIDLVLEESAEVCRTRLHYSLMQLGKTEAEFYKGVLEHAPGMHLTSLQWYELLSRLPTRMLRSQIDLRKFLSDYQIGRLPPEMG